MKSWFGKANAILLKCFLFLHLTHLSYAINIQLADPKDNSLVSNTVAIFAQFRPNSSKKNMTYKEVDEYLESQSKEILKIFSSTDQSAIMPLIKAILFHESGWKQFKADDTVYQCQNSDKEKTIDYGISQINNKKNTLSSEWDIEKIKNDETYNLRAQLAVLQNKKRMLQNLKSNSKLWASITKRAKLEGHSEIERLIKAYNGLIPSWSYVETVKKIAAAKPWENKVTVLYQVDTTLVNQQTVRLIDEYRYSWDSTTVKNGRHQLQTKIPKQSQDQISVEVKNGEGETTAPGDVSGTFEIVTTYPTDPEGRVDRKTINYSATFEDFRFYQSQAAGIRGGYEEVPVPAQTIASNLKAYAAGSRKVPMASYSVHGKIRLRFSIHATSSPHPSTVRYVNPYTQEYEVVHGGLSDQTSIRLATEASRQAMAGMNLPGMPSPPPDPFMGADSAFYLLLDVPLLGSPDNRDIPVFSHAAGHVYEIGGGSPGREGDYIKEPKENARFEPISNNFINFRFLGKYNEKTHAIDLVAKDVFETEMGGMMKVKCIHRSKGALKFQRR